MRCISTAVFVEGSRGQSVMMMMLLELVCSQWGGLTRTGLQIRVNALASRIDSLVRVYKTISHLYLISFNITGRK